MASFEYKRVCVNKFLGRCPACVEDYDINHHPNNFDCDSHYPIKAIFFEVEEEKTLESKV